MYREINDHHERIRLRLENGIRSHMTAAQKVCDAAGISLNEVCQRAEISPATFKHYIKHGAPYVAQVRIGEVFGDRINHLILIVGYESAMQVQAQAQSDRESRDASQAVGRGTSLPHRRTRSLLEVI